MRCVIRVSPNGRYDIIGSRYISGLHTDTFPSMIPDIAIVGKSKRLVCKAPNYTATCLIHRAICAVIDGYAYIYKAGNGLNQLQAFNKSEAEEIIQTCIQQVGGKIECRNC